MRPDNYQFRAILDWRMCSDPWPQGVNMEVVDDFLNALSREMGYADWIEAYHYF